MLCGTASGTGSKIKSKAKEETEEGNAHGCIYKLQKRYRVESCCVSETRLNKLE